MPDRNLRKTPVDCSLIAAAFCVAIPFTAFAQDDISTELRRCSLIVDGPARLDCYDALSGRRSKAASEPAGPPQEAAAIPAYEALDQDAVDAAPTGQATLGEGILDDQAADKIPLDPKPAEKQPVNPEIADTKTLDDLGSETLPRSSQDEAEKLEVRATVSRCEKDYRKKYRFHFDNGQIWKQTSDKRLYFRECNFDVTITQDFFGYKMKADGDKRQIRISRVK